MHKYNLLIVANFLLLVLIVQSCSEPKSEHLTFMDVSMGLTLDKFTDALKDKGFKHVVKDGDLTIMEGDFAGSVVQIAVRKTHVTERVAIVAVEFYTNSDKGKARELYEENGEVLDKKYAGCFVGKESKYFQHFIESPDVDEISESPNATLGDYKTYFASWKIPNGEVVMRVYNTCQFQIIYADSINFESGKDEMRRKMGSDI